MKIKQDRGINFFPTLLCQRGAAVVIHVYCAIITILLEFSFHSKSLIGCRKFKM